MTSIGSISGISLAATASGMPADPGAVSRAAIGEVGHRVLAWVSSFAGDTGGAAAWSTATGATSDFQPDARELAHGGDIYGLSDLGRSLGAAFGASPAQEGTLHRALESFTREAVIQVAGLSGGSVDRQLSGISDALATAGMPASADGIDGVIERIDTATAALARQNGR